MSSLKPGMVILVAGDGQMNCKMKNVTTANSFSLESLQHSSSNIQLASCLAPVKLFCPEQGLKDLLKDRSQTEARASWASDGQLGWNQHLLPVTP